MSKAGGIETLTQVRLDPPGFTLLIVPYTPCFKSLYYGLRISVEYPLSFQLSQLNNIPLSPTGGLHSKSGMDLGSEG